VTYLSTACAALVLVQAAFPAEARLAANAAYRAIMNPRCQPWPLPAEKYDSWRTLTFNFDSRDY